MTCKGFFFLIKFEEFLIFKAGFFEETDRFLLIITVLYLNKLFYNINDNYKKGTE